jgi:hypothetical protein
LVFLFWEGNSCLIWKEGEILCRKRIYQHYKLTVAIPDSFRLQVVYNLKYRIEWRLTECRVFVEDPTRIKTHHLEGDDFLHVVGDARFREKGRRQDVAYRVVDRRIEGYGTGEGVASLDWGRRSAEYAEEIANGLARGWRGGVGLGDGNESWRAGAVHAAEMTRQWGEEREKGVRIGSSPFIYLFFSFLVDFDFRIGQRGSRGFLCSPIAGFLEDPALVEFRHLERLDYQR